MPAQDAISPERSARRAARVRAQFVPGVLGPLHRLIAEPVDAAPTLGAVILVQPFDEELNRSRRTVAALARALAERGRCCIVVDHFGTGDSAGDFGEARWEAWREDLERTVASVRARGAPVVLAGLRAGASLVDALPGDALAGVRAVVAVAPEASPRALLRRWLMTESARRRFAGEPDASVKALRARLAAGEPVGCAGRCVHPELARTLDAGAATGPADGESAGGPRRGRVEIAPVRTDGVPDPARGPGPDVATLRGARFWQLEECPVDPVLVDALAAGIVEGGRASVRGTVTVSPPPPPTPSVPADWPERPLAFASPCGTLHGVAHPPATGLDDAAPDATPGSVPVAVVVVVGGAQYRVGAHRQFVLLARHLAVRGIPTLRFDLAGTGDSEGEPRDFLDNGAALDAAIDVARRELAPRVVLWGLCDGASAAVVHAAAARAARVGGAGGGDDRLAGIVMVNPWIRTEAGAARVRLRRYYLDRLRSPELLARVLRGRIDPRDSLRSLVGSIRAARGGRSAPEARAGEADDGGGGAHPSPALPTLVLDAIGACAVPVLVLVADADATAAEFRAAFDARFPDAVGVRDDAVIGHGPDAPRRARVVVPGDHTFSRAEDRRRVEALCADWIRRLG